MRNRLMCVLVAGLLTACAGTDGSANSDPNGDPNSTANNTNPNGTPNNTNPNGTPNNTNPNGTPNNTNPNGTPNNTNPNGTPNNTNPNGTPNNTNPNNTATTWRAIVAHGDFTADTSTYSIIEFDGMSASQTVPIEFGTGELAVAASGDRAFVVDLNGGMLRVLDAASGTEVETLDLNVGEVDSAASDNGFLAAGGGDMTQLALYSAAGGGLASPIPVADLTFGDPLYIRSMAMSGNLIAGVSSESSMFSSTPKVFVADASSSTLIGSLDLAGAQRIDVLGDQTFAVSTQYNGIKVLRMDAGSWNVDTTLIDAFGGAEIEGVVMADDNLGVALTSDIGADPVFQPYLFDVNAGMATAIDGIALATGLIGGDASADGEYFFIGDYGIRQPDPQPWGVAIVDREGAVVDHLQTDEALPPMDIAALN